MITFLEFLSQGRQSDIFLNKIETLLIFDPLITLWGHLKTPYFKMLNDARVASACLYVKTCQRARNSKNIATIRDFHLPSSFFCLSTRLQAWVAEHDYIYSRISDCAGLRIDARKFSAQSSHPSLALKATLSFSLRLFGSTIFNATFNLVTRVGIPPFLEHWKMIFFELVF